MFPQKIGLNGFFAQANPTVSPVTGGDLIPGFSR
jgi:hypothetical protein